MDWAIDTYEHSVQCSCVDNITVNNLNLELNYYVRIFTFLMSSMVMYIRIMTIMWLVMTFGFVLGLIWVFLWSLLGPFWHVLRSLNFQSFVTILVAALCL